MVSNESKSKLLVNRRSTVVIGVICFVLQIILVEFGGQVFCTCSLPIDIWMWCLVFGVGELAWGQVCETSTRSSHDFFLQGGAKNGAILSHCKYSENSMIELRGSSAILYAEHSH